MRVRLPVIIQVRSWVRAASGPTSHQYHFTLSYPVHIKSYIISEAHLMQSDPEVFVSISNPPEEHAHSGAAGSSVSRASSHVLPVQLAEAARALRAQHGPAEQAQGGMLPLIVCGLGAPEDERGAEQVERLSWSFR